MGSIKFRPQLMFVPSDEAVEFDFGRECDLRAVPSRYDLNLSLNEGKVLEVTVGRFLEEQMLLNIKILILGSFANAAPPEAKCVPPSLLRRGTPLTF